jgi:hypothetical protein
MGFIPRFTAAGFCYRSLPPRYANILSNSNPSCASACSLPLRLATKKIFSSNPPYTVSRLLFPRSPFPISPAVRQHSAWARSYGAVCHIPIPTASPSARNKIGFMETSLSNAHRVPYPSSPIR